MSRHLLRLSDWTEQEILEIVQRASSLKKEMRTQGSSDLLKGKTIALFFEKPSLRTITTFQVAMHQTGGYAVELDPKSIGIGKREPVKDVMRCLSRWVDALVVRSFEQKLLEEMSEHSSIPVINALTDAHHPCQALAFAQTMIEHNPDYRNKTIAFIGDGNNVANSLTELAAKLGMNFTLACPPGFEQPKELIDSLEADFRSKGCRYHCTHDPMEAAPGADVLYTDVWVSMGEEGKKDEKSSHFTPFQINKKMLESAKEGCWVTHCLPAHRGEEITDEIMESRANLCFDEAENRLHAQKAVLLKLLGK